MEKNIPPFIDRINQSNIIFTGKAYEFFKRIMDLTLVLLFSPFFILVLIICAAAVKIDSPDGPILFSQLRTGKGGKMFRMYKFRTMVPNAEELKEKYAHLNELEWPDFKIKNDPRITKVGKLLRKTSLDELPQIFNILIGNMSLVGPRPTDFGAEKYSIWHTERFDVLPGVTGLWQIIGRGEVEFDDKLRLDIIYVNKRCIKLDIYLLFQTIPVVLFSRGAY